MYNGHADHTGKRPMLYSASGYTGVQKYVASCLVIVCCLALFNKGEITNFEVVNGELKVTSTGNYKGKPEQIKFNLKIIK